MSFPDDWAHRAPVSISWDNLDTSGSSLSGEVVSVPRQQTDTAAVLAQRDRSVLSGYRVFDNHHDRRQRGIQLVMGHRSRSQTAQSPILDEHRRRQTERVVLVRGYARAQAEGFQLLGVFARRQVDRVPLTAQSLRGHRSIWRLANDHDPFELYLGINAEPNLDGPPTATFSALPISHPLPIYPAEYRIVLRSRDPHGLSSLNIYSRRVVLDAQGQAVPTPPKPPQSERLIQVDGSTALLRASYARTAEDQPADHWSLRLRTDGTDPQPTDEPTLVPMDLTSEPTELMRLLGPYTNGVELRVLPRTYRQAAAVESANTEVLNLTMQAGSAEGSMRAPGLFTGDRRASGSGG